MKPSRHQIAAGVTVVALGTLATVALASGGEPERSAAGAPAAAQSAPEVRTQIIRETVHRRARRSASGGSGGSGSSSAVRATASPSASASPSPAAPAVAPVATPDDHGGRRGRGSDDVGFDDHGGRGRRGDDDDFDDHGSDDHDDDDSGHGRGRGRGRGGDDD
jgi:hypothetical protein